MAFLAQKLIYIVNIRFNFVFGSFFQQDHLLNLFISWVMRKDDLNVPVFQYKNWRSPKSDLRIFFLTLTVRGHFHRKDFKWKNIWWYEVNFWKERKFYTTNLTKERKQPPVVILEQAILYSISIVCLYLRIIGTSDQDV